MVAPNNTFVGHEQELNDLTEALDSSVSGHGRVVALVGEPGIGKTRTCQELALIAQHRDARVLWGRCYEGEGAPPYWPWVQVFREYIQEADEEQLRADMASGAANIAEVVPELHSKLTDLVAPPQLEPQQARFRFFDSVTTFFKNASQRQPILLVIDDLHWAVSSPLSPVSPRLRLPQARRFLHHHRD